jgi:hypothetical protein
MRARTPTFELGPVGIGDEFLGADDEIAAIDSKAEAPVLESPEQRKGSKWDDGPLRNVTNSHALVAVRVSGDFVLW